MAEKRMISKVISISKKFNIELTDHFSRLLYVLLIPHSDDFGRLTGDPFKIKALILPMMNDVTQNDVSESLGKLHNARLIAWYESDGEKYIQINNFDEHQTGLHKRTRSKFPEPPKNSGKFSEIPPEQKRREENGIEGNRTEENGTEDELAASADPYIHVIDGFCKLHNKLDVHLKFNEREDAHELLNMGIPADFILSTIKKIHKQRTEKGEKITSLSYYKNAICEAWKGEKANEEFKGLQPNRNDGESEEDTERVGWLPSKYNTPEFLDSLPKVSGQ